jgi:hypothetical protein
VCVQKVSLRHASKGYADRGRGGLGGVTEIPEQNDFSDLGRGDGGEAMVPDAIDLGPVVGFSDSRALCRSCEIVPRGDMGRGGTGGADRMPEANDLKFVAQACESIQCTRLFGRT